VTPFESISETDIMPSSCANTSYAYILCQLMLTHSSTAALVLSIFIY
jgi:hypothetical protein